MVNGLMENILTNDFFRSIRMDDASAYHKTQAKVKSLDVPFKDKISTYGNMLYSESQSDMAGYTKHAYTYGKKYHWNDWNTLNNLAWNMYLNENLTDPKHVKVATKLAKRAVSLEANYYTTDTYAAILYKAGKYEAAQMWAMKSIEIAKQQGEDYQGTAELLEKINAAMKS
jgi:thioredoxin 1